MTLRVRLSATAVAAAASAVWMAGALPAPAAAQDNAVLPTDFVGRPTFQLKSGKEVTYGVAFGVTTDDGKRFLLTALHSFGPAGGLTRQIPSAELPSSVIHTSLYSMDFSREIGEAGGELVRDGRPYRPGSADPVGDLAAFALPDGSAIATVPLAPSDPAKGADVYVVAVGDSDSGAARIYHGTVVGCGATGLAIRLEEALSGKACTGAPIVDAAGRLVGMALDCGGDSQTVTAMPVSAIRAFLQRKPAQSLPGKPLAKSVAAGSAPVPGGTMHPEARGVSANGSAPPLVGRPLFQLQNRQIVQGAEAFGIRTDGGARVVITVLHLFGPSGGIALQMQSDRLPHYLKSAAFRTIDGKKIVGPLGSELVSDGYSSNGGMDCGGDLAAFAIPDGNAMGVYPLAPADPAPGTTVQIIGRIWNDHDRSPRTFTGTVFAATEDYLEIHMALHFDTSGFDGAPVLDGQGRVLGMIVGDKPIDPSKGKHENAVLAIPVSAIRAHLSDAGKSGNAP